MDNTNGIPFIWDQEEENQLLGQLNPFLETTNFNENSISSSKAFDEITFEKKIGAENKCLPCENSFYQGAMNFKLLISDLREKSRFDNDFFYYQKYTNNLPKVLIANPSMYTMGVTYSEIEDSIPFEYVNPKTKKRIETKFKVGLNTRACLVNFKIFGSRISIDEKNKNINLYIEYIYSDSKDKKIDNTATAVKNDYFIDDKYVAIKLETDDINDFFALCKEIEIYNTIKIKDLFVEKINATTIPSELDFLYENCPDEVIEIIKRNQEIKEDKIWNDILLLTKLDTEKFFTDTSSAFMNALKLIGYSGSIYDKFFSNQALVKTIYENLDGSSLVNGQQLSNKMQFANFIYALCAVNQFKGLKRKNKTFKYGPNDVLDSDVFFTFNEKDDEILLQQLKKVQHYYEVNTETDDLGITANVPTREEVDEEEIEVDQGAYYKVLDIVYLKDTSKKNAIALPVPAIFVKALSDEVEFQEIEKNIRLGFDILAIVAGVITLATTANPGILALAIADITLATGDIAIQGIAEELQKTPEGQEFLATWEKIYMVGGIATAIISVPQLVQSFYKGATKFVKFAVAVKNYNYLNFARALMLRAFLDINISVFVSNTVRVLENNTEIVLATSGVLNEIKVKQLFQNGVLTVVGQVQNGEKLEEQVALIYKGEALINSPKNTFLKASKELMNNLSNEKKFLEVCEEIYRRIPKREGNFWVWENFSGTKMQKPYLIEKVLFKKIEDTIVKNLPEVNGSSLEDLFEAEVGKEMFKLGKQYNDRAIDFANKINKGNIGEIDYSSHKYIVEAKTNLDNLKNLKNLKIQLGRYLHKYAEIEPNYINAQNKTVVVVHESKKIDKINKESKEIIEQLEKDGVIFVDGIQNLKKLY